MNNYREVVTKLADEINIELLGKFRKLHMMDKNKQRMSRDQQAHLRLYQAAFNIYQVRHWNTAECYCNGSTWAKITNKLKR